MDRHDAKDLPGVIQHIQERKKALRDAQSRKGQRPRLDPPDVVFSRFKFNAMANTARKLTTANDPMTHSTAATFVPPAYHPCVKPLTELVKTYISDLVLETQHRGKYLLVRCATGQDRMTAVLAIAEDERRDAILLQLYHQQLALEPGEEILTEGRVLIIKEPFLKSTANTGYALRVDHLSDIIFLAPDDERIPPSWRRRVNECTAMGWKTKGNGHFEKGEYRMAIEAYTRALGYTLNAAESDTIRLNRSLAFLKMEAFDRALSDVLATSCASTNEKALFRKSQALYGLQRFRDCGEVLKDLRQQYPDNNAAKDLFNRAVTRLAEQLHGRYDFKKMHAEAEKLHPPQLDHATYIGPIAIKDAGIGGRGTFTTRAVSAGELLLCEKAFAHAFIDEAATGIQGLRATMVIDAIEERASIGGEAELLNMAVQKIWRNPSLASAVTSLHRGSYQSVNPSTDETLVASPSTASLSVISPSATSSSVVCASATSTPVDGAAPIIVDTFLIRRIIDLNSFGCPRSSAKSLLNPEGPSGKSDSFQSIGLWTQASYTNHSCVPNIYRSFIGDMVIIRATRNLPAGTELVWWYQPPPTGETTSYLDHQKKLRQQWGFTCKCAMCRDLRDTPKVVLQRRQELRAEFAKLIPPKTQSGAGSKPVKASVLKKAASLVEKINATYQNPAARVPRLAVADLNLVLARRYGDKGEAGAVDSARYVLAALDSYGFVINTRGRDQILMKEWGMVLDSVLDAWLYLMDTYRIVARGLVGPTREYAKTVYKICIGEDVTFEDALA